LERSVIRRLVLDVLKPHEPSLPEFASHVCKTPGVKSVNVMLVEMDEKTESLRVIVEGDEIDFELLKKNLGECGAVIHSVDEVVVSRPVPEGSRS